MEDGKQIIGLTGGTGSGKSSVAALFVQRGVRAIDADQVSRQVCRPGQPCLQEIVQRFGPQVLDETGALRRKALGDLVFGHRDRLEDLNRITHKYIIEEIRRIIEECEEPAVLIDAALLYESGVDALCDTVVAVVAEEEVRAQRIARRDDLSMEQALQRIHAQHDSSFYTDKADFVVYNNGDTEELRMQTGMILDLLFGE
ncbi:MAG: dephospho-CoA kinase [Eubacteriales bacterium]|jgi:dephospho-CoA kinase